jgi:hypothetical protein
LDAFSLHCNQRLITTENVLAGSRTGEKEELKHFIIYAHSRIQNEKIKQFFTSPSNSREEKPVFVIKESADGLIEITSRSVGVCVCVKSHCVLLKKDKMKKRFDEKTPH